MNPALSVDCGLDRICQGQHAHDDISLALVDISTEIDTRALPIHPDSHKAWRKAMTGGLRSAWARTELNISMSYPCSPKSSPKFTSRANTTPRCSDFVRAVQQQHSITVYWQLDSSIKLGHDGLINFCNCAKRICRSSAAEGSRLRLRGYSLKTSRP